MVKLSVIFQRCCPLAINIDYRESGRRCCGVLVKCCGQPRTRGKVLACAQNEMSRHSSSSVRPQSVDSDLATKLVCTCAVPCKPRNNRTHLKSLVRQAGERNRVNVAHSLARFTPRRDTASLFLPLHNACCYPLVNNSSSFTFFVCSRCWPARFEGKPLGVRSIACANGQPRPRKG